MNTKNILTVMGVVMGLQGIGIFFGAESITKEAFAALEPQETGITIGAMLHEVMGVMCVMVAIILLMSRSLAPAAASKVLLGASIGIAMTTAHGFYNMFSSPVKPPLPLLLIMIALGVVGFITAFKAKASDAAPAAE